MEKQYRDSKGKPTTKKKYEKERLKEKKRIVSMMKKELAEARKKNFHDDGATGNSQGSPFKGTGMALLEENRPNVKGRVIKNKKNTQKSKVFTAKEGWKLNDKKLNNLLSKKRKDIKASKKKVGA